MEFAADTFGKLNAEDYDALNDPGTTNESTAFLAELYGSGSRVLELAIGSGRMALPLVQKGISISGIEGSEAMVDLLRAKPGGRDIGIEVGDMAAADGYQIDGPFDHAFLVFNTLFNLTTQAAQVQCFRNVAAKLNPGGTFLIETFVPDLSSFKNFQHLTTKRLDMGFVWLEAAVHDPLAQRLDMQRVRILPDGVKLVPLQMRYAFPPEIDLMAQLAGFNLASRWGGWNREPFDRDSKMHVSLYRLG